MRNLIFLVLLLIAFNLNAQTVIKVTRTTYEDILGDISKYSKKNSKDIKLLYICASERLLVFDFVSDKYNPNSFLINLELQFIDAEFAIKTEEEIKDSRCINEIKEYLKPKE